MERNLWVVRYLAISHSRYKTRNMGDQQGGAGVAMAKKETRRRPYRGGPTFSNPAEGPISHIMWRPSDIDRTRGTGGEGTAAEHSSELEN